MSKSIGNVVDPDVVINGGDVSQTLEFPRIAHQKYSLPDSAAVFSLHSCLEAELQKAFPETLATLQFRLAGIKTLSYFMSTVVL